jgi:hypothetical protein
MRNGLAERVYRRLLELPVAIVLSILWLAGSALLGLCFLSLYLLWLVLSGLIGA